MAIAVRIPTPLRTLTGGSEEVALESPATVADAIEQLELKHPGVRERLLDDKGVRKFINVRDLDIDLIDRINPFEAAYAVLAKTMDEKSLRQIQASIAGKNIKITEDEARELAKRALQFKNERGRVPDINSADAWEKRMAEGVAAFARYRAQAKAAQAQGTSGNG